MGASYFSKPAPPVQVLMLGLDHAGKTSILCRLAGEEMRSLIPTHGFSIKWLSLAGKRDPAFKVWDLGGARGMRAYWPAYFGKAQAIIFVIDATDRRRLHETSLLLQQLLGEEKLAGKPLLLLANKQDLPLAFQAEELEELLHLASIKDRAWMCLGCSALRGTGLSEGFVWLHQSAATS
ncbi:hypothetical protein AB1Y20_007454 [Prymnesium parvum]|uniref:ADP-ribosylation factor-like protein 3 n=1 Tax=Prymnesium parvum TaxID=97485 RepID=A0AB34IXJ6_PRYPA